MIKAEFIARINRFTAQVKLADGQPVYAHVANSGRLKELFRPGTEVYLVRQTAAHRVTQYDLALVRYKGLLVSVDARIPNELVSRSIQAGWLPEFQGWQVVKREVPYGASRLDILLADTGGSSCYVEVKSCTLVVNGTARFPDAPTERGARHLAELSRAVAGGHRAAVIFLIQREDARSFAPNDETDPAFGQALRQAAAVGVEVYAYLCRVATDEIKILGAVPVII